MPSWDELQSAYRQQEGAWESYFEDLLAKAAAAKLAFQDFLGVTDNMIRPDGQEPKHKVMLGRLSNGKWVEGHRNELIGSGRHVDFGIGITTVYGRSLKVTFAELRVERREGGYIFALTDPSEEVRIMRGSANEDFTDLSIAIYRRFEKYFSKQP